MKTWQLDRKVNDLSEKLMVDALSAEGRLDFGASFSDAEKALLEKVGGIEEKYRQSGSVELLLENSGLISKSLEVILRHIEELYCSTVPLVLGGSERDEIVEYFFRLHYRNFEADLSECLAKVGKWSEKERGEFLLDLRKNGAPLFRIPRGFDDIADEKDDNSDNSKLPTVKEEKEEHDKTNPK
jgi:hypothetical protein